MTRRAGSLDAVLETVRRLAFGAAALVVAWAVGPAAGAEDRPPVLLRETLLLTPVEATGTGLAPEVKVRVVIDERGRVTTAEVLSIEPSSELDEAFRRSTVAELLRWRYAPAIRDGQPVATRLEWTVQFRVRSEARSVSSTVLLPPEVLLEEEVSSRRQWLLSQPFAKQQELLLSYARVAEKHLDRARRQEFDTPRFKVVTDAENPEAAAIVGRNLEAATNIVHRLLEPHIEPQPARLKVLVYLYSHRVSFLAMRAELMSLGTGEATYYPPGFIIYHLELPSEAMMSVLIHEATHAYSDRHLRRLFAPYPIWLEEGFAEYMGNSQIKKGELQPGRVLKKRYVLAHVSGAHLSPTGSGLELEQIQRALRAGEGLSLREMMTDDRNVFYGERSGLYYGTAWLFVHFLRHGEPEWAEDSFPKLLLYLAEGYPTEAALEAAYGKDVSQLEEPFLAYLKKF